MDHLHIYSEVQRHVGHILFLYDIMKGDQKYLVLGIQRYVDFPNILQKGYTSVAQMHGRGSLLFV